MRPRAPQPTATYTRTVALTRRGVEVRLTAQDSPSELAHALVDVLVDRQAEDVLLLDLTALAAFADYFVIATVDNIRQSRAIVDALDVALRERGHDLRAEGDAESGWILVDCGLGVVVHLFSREARVHYNLEGLWHRAQEVVRIQ